MALGVASYFAFKAIPFLAPYKGVTLSAVESIQPVLLFCMLFVSFCKVDPTGLRPCRWHLWLMLIQLISFGVMGALLWAFPELPGAVCIEGLMLCMICPTATAAAIVTGKLGGKLEGLVTYTILINMVVAVAIPAIASLLHPHPDLNFASSFWLISGRVFPTLICPFFAAIVVKYVFPGLHALVLRTRDFAFYLWAISLTSAIAMSTKSLMHSHCGPWIIGGLATGSLAACIFQFWAGRTIGKRYGQPISCSQSLGQKATVFAIWAGYTFFDPLSCIAGGFYSIWHNVWNTIQLRRKGF